MVQNETIAGAMYSSRLVKEVGNLPDPIKVKEGKREEIDLVLKQKLFDHVPESACAERRGKADVTHWNWF